MCVKHSHIMDVLLGRCAPEKAPLSVGGLHLSPRLARHSCLTRCQHPLTAQYDAFDDILIDAPAGIERGFRLAASGGRRKRWSFPRRMRSAFAAAAVDALYAMDIAIHLIINRFKAACFKTPAAHIDQVIDSAGACLLGIVPMIRMLRTVRRWANQCL